MNEPKPDLATLERKLKGRSAPPLHGLLRAESASARLVAQSPRLCGVAPGLDQDIGSASRRQASRHSESGDAGCDGPPPSLG